VSRIQIGCAILENAALLGGPDASGAMDDFEQKFEDSRPDPWLVFCKYTASCDLLAERMRKKFGAEVGIFTGDVSTHHRTEMVAAYQRGEIDVIVGTIAAMYQGITLTRGNKQFWLSREVVPAINEQGEARQDRLGQQELVQVYIPQAPNTVASNKVQVINDLKTGIVAAVVPQDEIKETRSA
jgi:SNF2 family DNA or RNA helicase